MKMVLDSCVAFKWLVRETDTDKALRIRDDFSQQLIDLISPDIFPAETIHALTRAERQKRITPQEGAQLFHDFTHFLPQLEPYLPLLPRAYEISSAARIGIYDCLYVALAEREGCQLITSDQKLLTNLGPRFPFIVALSGQP